MAELTQQEYDLLDELREHAGDGLRYFQDVHDRLDEFLKQHTGEIPKEKEDGNLTS